jgi:aminoglycoside phosphotransferase family enzyme/predicted kinase
VQTIETHISWVFLAGRFAYKLKKPLRFEFLNFSTPELRRQACVDEVRLNRRLAPDVYLASLPITVESGRGLKFGGNGQVVDHVVKMRRLPSDRAVDRLIRNRALQDADVVRISRFLAEFYTRLPPQVLRPHVHHQRLVAHCRANLQGLLANGAQLADRDASVARIHGAQVRFLWLESEMFGDRVRDGRIVDGHGDLRAEHIYLESNPVVIDCLEFSRELREVDAVDDLCFLAMDCQRLGEPRLAERLLVEYQHSSGDRPPEELLAFYKSYRACVRAKVAFLRGAQAQVPQAREAVRQAQEYLQWADNYAAQLGPPLLVVIGGLMGSGKSTLATRLAQELGGVVLRTDTVRRALFGRSRSAASYAEGLYDQHHRARVYHTLFAHAQRRLAAGGSVVLDGTFLTNDLRGAAVSLGERLGASTRFVQCVCPREISLQRMLHRGTSDPAASEARPELYDDQLGDREPVAPMLPAVWIDTTLPMDEQLDLVRRVLNGRRQNRDGQPR